MYQKKVSVIIPCYNATKYLPQCFLSLVNQTIGIEHLELIFVDDASTDDGQTWALLQEMEQAYPNSILVIHLDENMRQGGARNVGLEYACGEYIGFVDADDWVDETLFEKAYLAAKQEDADIVQFGFHAHINGVGIVPAMGEKYQTEVIRKPEDSERKKMLLSKKITFGCWNKIYRTELVKKVGAKYAEHLIYEEVLFVYPLLLYAKCFFLLEEQLYFYRQNPVGTMYATMKEASTLMHHGQVQLQLLHFMQNTPYFESYKDEIQLNFIHSYLVETLYFSARRHIPIDMDTFASMRETIIAEIGLPSQSNWIKKYPLKKKFLELIESDITEEQLNQCIRSLVES